MAEGVEDAEVLVRLRELDCDCVQGFHVERPAPADQLRLAQPAAGRMFWLIRRRFSGSYSALIRASRSWLAP